MTKFGEVLRTLRQTSNDPDHHQRRLSQGRLGVLIGHEMDDRGVSGAAVSDWERGESTIRVEDRNILLAIIKVLYRCEGIQTPADANRLLEAGEYRALNQVEIQQIFGEDLAQSTTGQPTPEARVPKSFVFFLSRNLFLISEEDWEAIFVKTRAGPPPAWPRILAALMRKASDRFSISLRTIFWIWLWLLAWWLIAPSLRWPFADRKAAYSAILMYVAGTLVVPLLVGLLVPTRDSNYWQQLGLIRSKLLRLYTYQGAGIGFNLGYFFVFPLVLVRYYLHLESSIWLEFAAVTLALILANMSARVVPHNLWLAYGRLHFSDGGIFFVVALMGPLWGFFFMQYYDILLTPFLGSVLILVAITAVVVIATLQSRKKPRLEK